MAIVSCSRTCYVRSPHDKDIPVPLNCLGAATRLFEMVVYEWFARIGQVLAPDKNYKPEDAEKDPSIWDILAPDPNFTSDVRVAADPKNSDAAATPLTFAADALMRSPAPQQRDLHPQYTTTATPSASVTSFVPCPSCLNNLCLACQKKASAALESERKVPLFETPALVRGSDNTSTVQTPRSTTTPSFSSNVTNVEGRVLSAALKQAETMASPVGALKGSNQILRLCASTSPLEPPLQKKLKQELQKPSNRSVLTARSSNMGHICPDGYTPFMAAAYANHVVAANIICDLVQQHNNADDDIRMSMEDLLLATNLQGKTAFHIAAEKGHSQFVQFVQSKHRAVFGTSVVPVDLLGRTPLGAALTSPDPKASGRNKAALWQQLYSPTDPSVRGCPPPADHRVIYAAAAASSKLRAVAGWSEMPGQRIRMEDCTVARTVPSAVLLAVCDGHDDDGQVSRHVAEHWVSAWEDRWRQQQLPFAEEEWQICCRDICLTTDDALRKSKLRGGSVGVLLVVTETHVVVANVGDCRCILVQRPKKADTTVTELVEVTEQMTLKDDGPPQQEEALSDGVSSAAAAAYTVTALSTDHKPDLPVERARIEKAGLSIMEETIRERNDDEVITTIAKINLSDGNRLACSRAFGDFEYKANATLAPEEQAVTAVPEVVVHSRCVEDDVFLIAACDGVWDVMTNESVATFVTERMEHYYDANHNHSDVFLSAAILPTVGDELLVECLNRGSGDNMSVVIVALSEMADRLLDPSTMTAPVLQGKALNFTASTPGQGSNEADVP